MKPPDPVTAYARAVVSGKVPSGKLQRQACERHLKDQKRFNVHPYMLDDPRREKWKSKTEFYWDPYWAEKKLGFFPQLIHWRDRLAGRPFVLMPWQAFVAGSLLGWFKRERGYRFHTAYVCVPKKSGKSVFMGALALLLGFFDGVEGGETYSIATTKDQADLVWNEAANLAARSQNPLVRRLKVSSTNPAAHHNIHDPITRSKFEPISADKDSGDGKNPHVLIADEVHRYKDAGLLNMLKESTATRESPMTIEITTAGWNRVSICYKHDELSQKILQGTVQNDGWFAFICRADEEDRKEENWWNDPKVWAKANPSLGVAIREEQVRGAATEANLLPDNLNDFLRYRLNIWTEQNKRAITMERWIASGEGSPMRIELLGRECFGGLDLASLRDLCAFSLIFPEGERVPTLVWFWIPEKGLRQRVENDKVPYDRWVDQNLIKVTSGDTTDYEIIKADVLQILEHFRLRVLAYDPYNAGSLPHQLVEDLGEERVVKFGQHFNWMAAPCNEIERLYLAGLLKHGNNPVLNWMAQNAAWGIKEPGVRRFDREESSDKIDGMVATAMAVGAWLRTGNEESNESVYDRENRSIEIF